MSDKQRQLNDLIENAVEKWLDEDIVDKLRAKRLGGAVKPDDTVPKHPEDMGGELPPLDDEEKDDGEEKDDEEDA